MVIHICNSITWEAETEDCYKFEACLVYTVNLKVSQQNKTKPETKPNHPESV